MKKMNAILKKCKSLSRLGRSLSYSSLRSKSVRKADELWSGGGGNDRDRPVVVLVGNSKRPYLLSSKHLDHPVLSALVVKSELGSGGEGGGAGITVRCEVVLFDHLLWMLENADLEVADSLELAGLYAY